MISNNINLTKIFLKSSFNSGRKRKNRVLSIVLYAGLAIYFSVSIGYLSYEIINALLSIHQEEAFISLVMMAIISLTIFTSVSSCLNTLYFAKDNIHILPLPLKGREILSSKTNVLLIYNYIEEFMFGLVPFGLYGYLTHQPTGFYLMIIPVLIFLPVIPLLLVELIVIIIMSLTNGVKNKNAVQMFTTVTSIIIILFATTTFSGNQSEEQLMEMLNQANGLSKIYANVFPTMPLALSALAKQNVLSLLVLIVISIAAYILVSVFCEKPYNKGMLGCLFSSSGISKKRINRETAYKSKGLLYSYVGKEFKVYLRNPTFFVQLILPQLILSPFMIILLSVSFRSGGEDMDVLYEAINSRLYSGYVFGALLLTAMFCSMYSYISPLAVSKDGHDAYLMKYVPVPFYKQLEYKMSVDVIMSFFSCFVSVLLGSFLFRVPIGLLALCTPVILLYCVLHGFLIIFDARNPKLNWTSEIEISKRNMRMFLSLGYAMINMAIVALMTYLFNLNMILIGVILCIVYAIIILISYTYIKKKDIVLSHNF